ncbi:MAG: GxxExxY protein, partial [Candidatus Cloacimonetes bacterium]|nr:GxxExxY protein [Candidatus Cloacimonadota bacterium]
HHSNQLKFPVVYRGKVVDEYIPDLVVENKVVVEIKTVESITDEHRGQLLNYLRISGIKVGLIINFKHSKMQWERLVLDTAR